ncbi:MAG: hypothetical protein D8M57_13020 [Candidatus Scalindua sp. AMX11]|nr:MAG: hypothetical protein DWQ00_12070 [Candidatus Scalindua sp.]NOG83807.1 hypothetical protein [Planctomycetota bacterium]RZV82962.1 MAG: hypothetical protein EX341_09225 [Candidatus Scalindua sp. SCAELEC01]TDE64416.1 MAG: hypothetical protein D8M57_13020 [Candidatus Scalindua sp. AMX11]GJQ59743.1 MAG: hypothetical protein SCALA701_25440 [Candidatus Scalindua sp.]
MDSKKQTKINNRQKMDIASLSLDKVTLRKFCDILQERANSAAEIELGFFKRNEQSHGEYEDNRKTLRESFKLKITISGKDGEQLWGSIVEVFDSANFPEEVRSLYVDSESTLRHVHNYYPHNSFQIFLDFNKPKIFDMSLLPSQGTPNQSKIEVQGYDATWVNGVFSELKQFIDKRSSTLSIVHSHSIYDILLLVLGFPSSFWVCSKLSNQIETAFESGSVFVINALYLYVFVITLFIFRVLFHYIRWVCPLVEYQSKDNKIFAHRAVSALLCIGWFGQIAYDVVKWLFKT